MLIGDSCTDEYQYGVVERISPEAPVPVFRYLYSEEKPGMVYNVKANLEKFPVTVTLFTDLPSLKIRLIDQKTKHHIARIDRDSYSKESFTVETKIPKSYDAIVISDYDKGYVSYEFLEEVSSLFDGPIYIDTKKKNLKRIKNCFIKINEQERNDCHSVCEKEFLIITMGSKGTYYNGKMYEGEPVEVADVCGAGDTFLAALTYFHLRTCNIETAIKLANRAAAITVQHFGTYAPNMEEYL